MINRIVPACSGLQFCAKNKTVPGEISRVKKSDIITAEEQDKRPKFDTFTSSRKVEDKTCLVAEDVSRKNTKHKSQVLTNRNS